MESSTGSFVNEILMDKKKIFFCKSDFNKSKIYKIPENKNQFK